MKILVIKRDKIGDLLLTTPALRHLRRSLPDARIHLLANDYNAWVIAGNTDIDRVWVYPRTRVGRRVRIGALLKQISLRMSLRRQHFDIAIIANGDESPRAIQWGLHSGARRMIGYCSSHPLCRRLTDPLPVPEHIHESERLVQMLAPLGIAPPRTIDFPRYLLPEELRRFAQNWLARHGLAPGGYIVLGLGARRVKKQPTTEQILRWCAHVKQRHRLDTVFMWTPGGNDNPLYPGDDHVARPVLARQLSYIHPFRGPVREAIALIWLARSSILPDSGLMHFAAASPGGVLGLFAEIDVSPSPEQWGPRGPEARYLVADKSVGELDDDLIFSELRALLE